MGCGNISAREGMTVKNGDIMSPGKQTNAWWVTLICFAILKEQI
jgi:hypothetical protein